MLIVSSNKYFLGKYLTRDMMLSFFSSSYDYSTTLDHKISLTSSSFKEVFRKKVVCPRCGWTARIRRVICDENGCFEEYICTRCLYVFKIKIE